jgi:arginine/ornithine transport system permease protein
MFDFQAIIDALPVYGTGFITTLKLLLASIALGLAAAIPLAVLRNARSRLLRWPVVAFTYVIRGTPLLVQLFIIYYGLAQFDLVRESVFWTLLSSAWFCAMAAFAINTAAYTTEMIAGSMRALPHGEIEAARSLGLSPAKIITRIVLPSALRRTIPAYSNEVIMMLHGTSLASAVTLMDLTGAAREMYARTYLPFEAFITVGLVYLSLTFVLVFLFHRAEARFLVHLKPRKTVAA